MPSRDGKEGQESLRQTRQSHVDSQHRHVEPASRSASANRTYSARYVPSARPVWRTYSRWTVSIAIRVSD